MHRLFVAIPIPDDIVMQLDRLCQGLPGARWTDPMGFHLTLRFVGEVDGSSFAEIGQGLMDIRMPPFDLTLDGLGHFPPKGCLKQLWAGVTANAELTKLKRQIDRVVIACDVLPESRKFAPHVTIGRFRSPPPSDRLASYLAPRSAFKSARFAISGFNLYSSHLRHDGAEHLIEAEYDFVTGAMIRD